jgi:23S rRNA pseudouridine1911/1915/1917 synthase
MTISRANFQKTISLGINKITQAKTESRIFTLSVKKRFDGFTLLDLYSSSFPHVEREYWKSKIESGNLILDGEKSTPNQKIKAGQITVHSVPPKEEPLVNFEIQLIKATDDYWVINKPSPLPVHAGGRYQNNTLTNIIKTAFPNQNIHLINRLDANTTGIVLVALNKETAQNLGKQFENREVTKTYLALVEGIPKKEQFQSSKSVSKTKTSAGGRKLEEGHASNTDFEILKTFDKQTLLKVTPYSGRTNQIRLHLADLGLPIVGDLGYKNPEYFKNNPLTYPGDTLFLHAWKLKFYDSKIDSEIEITVEVGSKWKDFL